LGNLLRLNLKLKIELCLIKHQINKTSDKNISDSQFGNNYEQRNMNGTKDLLANLQWQTCNGKPAMANLQWQTCNGKPAMAIPQWKNPRRNFVRRCSSYFGGYRCGLFFVCLFLWVIRFFAGGSFFLLLSGAV